MLQKIIDHSKHFQPILNVLYLLNHIPNSDSNDLLFYLRKKQKISKNSFRKIFSFLKENSLIQTFKSNTSYHVYKITSKGELIASYIFPLKTYTPGGDLLLFVSPETAASETNVSLQTIKKRKSFFTYITIDRKLYVIKKYSIRKTLGQNFIQKKLPSYPYINSFNELLEIIENPPASFIKKILKLSRSKDHPEIYAPALYDFILTTYNHKISTLEMRQLKKMKKKKINKKEAGYGTTF